MLFEDWFLYMTQAGGKLAHSLAILTLWCLWKRMNASVFQGTECTVEQTVAQIKDEASLWASTGGRALAPLFVASNVGSN